MCIDEYFLITLNIWNIILWLAGPLPNPICAAYKLFRKFLERLSKFDVYTERNLRN